MKGEKTTPKTLENFPSTTFGVLICTQIPIRIPILNFPNSDFLSGARAIDDDMIEELEIHLKLEDTHDNVVNLIGVCSTTGGII